MSGKEQDAGLAMAEPASGRESEKQGCSCNSSPGGHLADLGSAAGPPPEDFEAMGFGPDGAEIDQSPSGSIDLATIELSNGVRVEFIAVEEEAGKFGLAMRELAPSNRLLPPPVAMSHRGSVAETFLRLCPDGPVPRLLATSLDTDSGRKLVDLIDEPIAVDLDELAATATTAAFGPSSGGGTGGQFCVPGDGWHAFKAFACSGSHPSNAWVWCDPGAHYNWRDRWTSGHKRKNSFGITAACHGPAMTRHYRRKSNGKWKRMYTWYLPAGHWQWTRYEGHFNFDRWVHHRSSVLGAPSWVRCFTAIYS